MSTPVDDIACPRCHADGDCPQWCQDMDVIDVPAGRGFVVGAARVVALVLVVFFVVFAVHQPSAPVPAAPAATRVAAPAAGSGCWVEHKAVEDGGDETLCGALALMPAGSSLLPQ